MNANPTQHAVLGQKCIKKTTTKSLLLTHFNIYVRRRLKKKKKKREKKERKEKKEKERAECITKVKLRQNPWQFAKHAYLYSDLLLGL